MDKSREDNDGGDIHPDDDRVKSVESGEEESLFCRQSLGMAWCRQRSSIGHFGLDGVTGLSEAPSSPGSSPFDTPLGSGQGDGSTLAHPVRLVDRG